MSVSRGYNGRKFQVFLHCIFQKGSKIFFFVFRSKRLVPNLELKPFFGEKGPSFLPRHVNLIHTAHSIVRLAEIILNTQE